MTEPAEIDFELGQRVARWLRKQRGGFAAGLYYEMWRMAQRQVRPDPEADFRRNAYRHAITKHDTMVDALVRLDALREKHIAQSRELSLLKRKKSTVELAGPAADCKPARRGSIPPTVSNAAAQPEEDE